jgi:hypothetical protein
MKEEHGRGLLTRAFRGQWRPSPRFNVAVIVAPGAQLLVYKMKQFAAQSLSSYPDLHQRGPDPLLRLRR